MLGTLDQYVPLEQDKRRLSLEGAMVATGLGVILLYLIQDAEASNYLYQEDGNIFQDGILTADATKGAASYNSRQGKITINPVAPLEDVAGAGSGEGKVKSQNGQTERGNQNETKQNTINNNNAAEEKVNQISDQLSLNDVGSQSSGVRGNETNLKEARESLNQNFSNTSFVVIVKSDTTINSQSVEGIALIDETLRQIGIQDNRITLDPTAEIAIEILSNQQGEFSAKPFDNKAITEISNEHAGSLRSIITGAKDVNVNVDDSVRLVIDAREAQVNLINDVTGIERTSIQSTQEGLLGNIHANSEIELWVSPNAKLHDQNLKIITSALRDSVLESSGGDDIYTIVSSFNGSLRDYSKILMEQQDQFVNQESDLNKYSLDLLLSSQGLNNTTIHTGAGNDHLTIAATINPDLVSDLEQLAEALGSDQSHTGNTSLLADEGITDGKTVTESSGIRSIRQERIGAINSVIDMGDGDDYLRVTGQIINSSIDMGQGINHVVLEDDIDSESTIFLGDSGSRIEYRNNMNSTLTGSKADEVFLINKNNNQGYIDGNEGSDTLKSQSSLRKVLTLNDTNEGTLEGIQFKGIENVDLGPGDDIVIMDFKSSLTGKLLGGDGLDRLDYSNWQNPVNVDLDFGVSTSIFDSNPQGAIGFEQVIGGHGSDFLASTGAMDELRGSGGNDVMFHLWSPWLATSRDGTELYGDDGQDIFVIAGLNQTAPSDWDGMFGLPTIKDLDLSTQPTVPGVQPRPNDSIGLLQTTTVQNVDNTTNLQLLTPSGLEGIGDATRLPIASIEKLMLGAANANIQQLAIGLSSGEQQADMMYLIGKDTNNPIPIAYVESTGLNEIT